MIQRFFLNWIHVYGTWVSIGNGIQFILFIYPVPAVTQLVRFQCAFIGAYQALDAPRRFRIEKSLTAVFIGRRSKQPFPRKAKQASCSKKTFFYELSLVHGMETEALTRKLPKNEDGINLNQGFPQDTVKEGKQVQQQQCEQAA